LQLKNVDIVRSPLRPGRVRIVGEVVYDNRTIPAEQYWFDVPEQYRSALNDNGNPWFICLLPLAMTLGEPVKMDLPVDPVLYKNARKLQAIWKSWYPGLTKVSMDVPILDLKRTPASRTAAFFSGGVDSFFTVLRNARPTDKFADYTPVDDLITVGGFDIPLSREKEFEEMRRNLQVSADRMGKPLLDVLTNIRTTYWNKAAWGLLAHGCGLAAVAHVLDKRIGRALLATSGGYMDLYVWGTHVLTDPLLSSAQLSFCDDGEEFSRAQKTEFIAAFPEAMNALHVCYKLASEKNCSKCIKCYRTMMTLDVLGAKTKAPTFDWSLYKVRKVRNILLRHDTDRAYMKDIRKLAIEHRRRDIVLAINESFTLSKYLGPLVTLSEKIQNRRYLRSLGTLLHRCLTFNLIK
jgi:hypothetical protein